MFSAGERVIVFGVALGDWAFRLHGNGLAQWCQVDFFGCHIILFCDYCTKFGRNFLLFCIYFLDNDILSITFLPYFRLLFVISTEVEKSLPPPWRRCPWGSGIAQLASVPSHNLLRHFASKITCILRAPPSSRGRGGHAHGLPPPGRWHYDAHNVCPKII